MKVVLLQIGVKVRPGRRRHLTEDHEASAAAALLVVGAAAAVVEDGCVLAYVATRGPRSIRPMRLANRLKWLSGAGLVVLLIRSSAGQLSTDFDLTAAAEFAFVPGAGPTSGRDWHPVAAELGRRDIPPRDVSAPTAAVRARDVFAKSA